ncbi:MAG: acylphosphatase [Burkholderiaceae bacterium]|nr:acylphosphatase [Burkholderiaceae bacterium]
MIVCRQLVIHGRVQGVGFRAALAREARRLALAGWVRNRSDGSVESVVAGEAAAVEALVRWARRGPPAAHVTRLEESAASGQFAGFEQRPTV